MNTRAARRATGKAWPSAFARREQRRGGDLHGIERGDSGRVAVAPRPEPHPDAGAASSASRVRSSRSRIQSNGTPACRYPCASCTRSVRPLDGDTTSHTQSGTMRTGRSSGRRGFPTTARRCAISSSRRPPRRCSEPTWPAECGPRVGMTVASSPGVPWSRSASSERTPLSGSRRTWRAGCWIGRAPR